MIHLSKLIYGTGLVLALSLIPETEVFCQTASGSDTTGCAGNISRHCRCFVYTVNAYTKLARDDVKVSETTGKKATWQRNVGTAISIDEDGHLITLQNVVDGADKIKIITSNGKKLKAHVIGSDYTGRITVLKIDPEFVSSLPTHTSMHDIQAGSTVYFLGVVPGNSVDVNRGLVSRLLQSDGTFEVKAPGVSGTSGTPVFDEDKNLLGLLAYQVDSSSERSADIPSEKTYLVISYEHAAVLAQRVISSTKPKCGWLGVCVDLKYTGDDGIHITGVIDGSPADQSDIQPDDIIYEYNGTPVTSLHQFSNVFTGTKAGDTVLIKLLRGERRLSVSVKLTSH